jgi:hypothetical protein
MFKKFTFIISLAVVFSLAFGNLALAMGETQWVVAFNPIEYGYQPIDFGNLTGGAQIVAMEEFGNALYFCVFSADGAQLFRSTDGSTFQPIGLPRLGTSSPGCWDMVVFKGMLYASLAGLDDPYPPAPAYIVRSADGVNFEEVSNSWEGSLILNPGTFGEFKGMIYVMSTNENGQNEVWRSETGDSGTWELAGDIGEWDYSAGGLVPFNGMLYLFGEKWDPAGVNILRSKDGHTWETVVNDGFASLLQDGTFNSDGYLAIHQGKLYIGVSNWKLIDPDEDAWEVTGQILSSSDGVNWSVVASGGFGDLNNLLVTKITTYLGDVYASVMNWATGVEIWKSHTGEAGTWVQVNEDGFGFGSNYPNLYSLAVYQDELFMATFGEFWSTGYIGQVMKLVHP